VVAVMQQSTASPLLLLCYVCHCLAHVPLLGTAAPLLHLPTAAWESPRCRSSCFWDMYCCCGSFAAASTVRLSVLLLHCNTRITYVGCAFAAHLWRMNTGLPLHLTVTVCPSWMLLRSTSREDMARVSAAACAGRQVAGRDQTRKALSRSWEEDSWREAQPSNGKAGSDQQRATRAQQRWLKRLRSCIDLRSDELRSNALVWCQ
jgi:hypothetical protein